MKSHRGVRVFQNADPGDGTVKAAIVVFDKDLNVVQYPKLTTNNITVVGIQTSAWKITLVSYYFEPDQPIQPYLDHLHLIEREIGTKWIIGGDANAKSSWWGSPEIDHRGEDMCGTLDDLSLHILNRGNVPTYDTIRGGKRYSSFIDVTACSTDLLALAEDWRVEPGFTSSDHGGVLFSIRLQKSKGIHINRTTRLYNTKKVNWRDFNSKLNEILLENDVIVTKIRKIKTIEEITIEINKFSNAITEVCNKTMPKKKANDELRMPWWSERLEKMKKAVATKKRRIRCAAPVRKAKVIEDFLKEKKAYEAEAAKAAVASWKEFCSKQDKEGLWEGIYRVIARTTRREEDLPLVKDGVVLDAKGSVKLLAESFYPEDTKANDTIKHRQTRELANKVNKGEQVEPCDPPFTMAELKWATQSFNPRKAPGADGFTADICSHAIEAAPEVFLELLNKCLELNEFPKIWKQATVVILRKPGRDSYTAPKAYRPIGLLPILGKIYEKMLIARLKFHLLPRFSTHQYGFMPQKSTEDALYILMQHVRNRLDEKRLVTLVSLDIEGAFDSAWWPAIRVRLAEENCPVNLRRVMDSYLSDRDVCVRYAGEEYRKRTSKGCVQGSIGGPILWNLLLDPLLKNLESRQIYCQAFADDVVLVFDGCGAQEIEKTANSVLARVQAWGIENKLKFAPHKTSAMTITRRLKYDTPRLSMGGTNIATSKEIKLLGVTIDEKLTFNTHVANACKKATGIYKQLNRAAKVSWGLHPEIIKTIYTATVEPVILYAASVWAPAVGKLGIQKQLSVVQRGVAQKLCRAYRTVSLHSALILAGILPLDLRVREAAALYEVRKGIPWPELRGREIERMASALNNPHPAESHRTDFISLIDRAQVEENSDHDVRIFTDGSKIEGKVGAALSWWNSEAETKSQKLTLPAYCSVYQAELLAICKATAEILKHRASSFGIYSDSRAALQTIANPNCLHPLAVETRENLKNLSLQNKVVSLFWIKAHAGLEGNERADVLAKEAALSLKKKPDYDRCPISFVKRQIRDLSLDEWDRRYRSSERAGVTKVFLPDVRSAIKIIRQMEMNKLVTQVLTGHGGFAEYLHRFKCKDDPSCVCDGNTKETIIHLLMECPQHDAAREQLQQELQMNLCRDTAPSLLAGKNSREAFLKYACKIAEKAVRRNRAVE